MCETKRRLFSKLAEETHHKDNRYYLSRSQSDATFKKEPFPGLAEPTHCYLPVILKLKVIFPFFCRSFSGKEKGIG